MFEILGKSIDMEKCKILFDSIITSENLKTDWAVYGGKWTVADGWLIGENPLNEPGVLLSASDYKGDIMLDFDACTLLPSTHDIDFMWNASWDEQKQRRGIAYVGGIAGWWENKVGFEKSPDYKLNVLAPMPDFKPGEIYNIKAGSIQGHCFIFLNNKLVIEMQDTQPIDGEINARVGFEAYCCKFKLRNLKIRQISWTLRKLCYTPEFN